MTMSNEKSLDLICLGRAAVDLYGQQIGSRLEDMGSFAKYLGGSSGNIAAGTARLGLQSAMLTRVGDEHMGRFVREELARNGVDISHVITDQERLTGMVVLGIKDRETFPLIFYRTDCADMAIDSADFSADFIGSAKALVITGTHFSTEQTYNASMQAIEYARAAGTKVVVDIDYRPVLWGLTSLGDGEQRFISDAGVSEHLQRVLPHCDLIVGTEEEVHIAGGSEDTITALKTIRSLSDATIVLKLGPLGCTVLDGAIPDSESEFDVFTGVRVEVLNVLGAGDAFMSGFLRGWLRGEDAQTSCAYANACGALVVSRHGCTPAIPSEEELLYYIENQQRIPQPDKDQYLNHLHRVTTRHEQKFEEIYGLAFDHRKQFYDMAVDAGADPARIPALKMLLARATKVGAAEAGLEGNIGVLVDDTYGQDVLNEITGSGWWIGRPVEVPSSRPIELEGGRDISARLQTWPKEHIVKCLVFYHPDDDAEMIATQDRQILELANACAVQDLQLLLEIIPPAGSEQDDNTIPRILDHLYDLDVRPDWWKLPGLTRNGWQIVTELVNRRGPHCLGVVMLGLDAPADQLRESFNQSAGFEICKGFTVGRTIFSEPSKQWLAGKIDDEALIRQVADRYLELIGYWRERQA